MPFPPATTIEPQWLGQIRYGEAWELQRQVFADVLAGHRPNTFLLCEHPDVITVGRNARSDVNLLKSRDELIELGYDVHDVDRGGDVTYHGPGQLVGYPIIRLADFKEDLGWYIRTIEELIMRTVAHWEVAGGRITGLSGVWCGQAKLCAIGVRASRWVTMHGFALNVTTNLARFDPIVPCGIPDHGVTSIEREGGGRPGLEEVAHQAVRVWDEVFSDSQG
jgi:lipoyl(octanoyl) transferase